MNVLIALLIHDTVAKWIARDCRIVENDDLTEVVKDFLKTPNRMHR